MGASTLHEMLKSLCLNTDWKYAVFWKLKHRARMMLTWEDGYYNSCEHDDAMEDKPSNETLEHLPGGYYSRDPLGLAVAKMSYNVYSLGEGVVGQVAVTGKHQWIIADQQATSSCPSFEISDGWQCQLSAGIRTIVVVAVAPHGVVQLGSLNKVMEDIKLVTHIKEAFSDVKDFSVGHFPVSMQCSMTHSLSSPDILAKSMALETIPNCFHNSDKVFNKEGNICPYTVKHSDGSSVHLLSDAQPKMVVELLNKHGGIQSSLPSTDGNTKLLQPRSKVINLQYQNQIRTDLIGDRMSGGETSGCRDLDLVSEQNATQPTSVSINAVMDSINLCNVELQAEKFLVDHACSSLSILDSTLCDKVKSEAIDSYETLYIPQSLNTRFEKDLEKVGNQNKPSHLGTSDTILKFFPGSELHEALGSAFLKKYNDKAADNNESADDIEACETIQIPETISNSLTFDSGPENLLEAVVATACHSASDIKSDKSFCKSVHSHLTSEKIPEPSIQSEHTINSMGYSVNQFSIIEEDAKCLSSSELCGAMSSKGISSACPSSCSEKLTKSLEPAKNNKKRARPGESCRPRPRDRQLIQDRIKELRELVPNGSKCSIDSLLERTIKHMLFLQSITKHADKLSKCAESKMHQKGAGIQGSSNYDQGSSWAVEVGSHLKVCSIIVENLNKNGQMLVEMMCEECSHFLEIAEAIRSLGLTILKGVTEAHGEKTWICFVVEGQDNRIMHRMDVLWSLVQLLQPKSTCS